MVDNQRNFPDTLPTGWFQIAYSDQIRPGEVKPLEYFDTDFVMFRTEDGQLCVLDAFCPHLGAHLGHGGKVRGSEPLATQSRHAAVAHQRSREPRHVLAPHERRGAPMGNPGRDS